MDCSYLVFLDLVILSNRHALALYVESDEPRVLLLLELQRRNEAIRIFWMVALAPIAEARTADVLTSGGEAADIARVVSHAAFETSFVLVTYAIANMLYEAFMVVESLVAVNAEANVVLLLRARIANSLNCRYHRF